MFYKRYCIEYADNRRQWFDCREDFECAIPADFVDCVIFEYDAEFDNPPTAIELNDSLDLFMCAAYDDCDDSAG